MTSEANLGTKKRRRIEKQNRRRHPEISKQIILIWEELRQKNVKSERKYELCEKIMTLSKSVLLQLVSQKTTARVFESVIEYGIDEHRWTIFESVKNDLLNLCKGKYSYFIIINMLKYGTKDQRLAVYETMKGHVVDLLQHAFACKVVEVSFNEFANVKQRNQMIQEFYGKTFALLGDDNKIKNLTDFTSNSNYDMSILQNLQKVLTPIITKGQVDLTIVQHVLYEYINVLTQSIKQLGEESGKFYVTLLNELLESIADHVLTMCNTRKGTKTAILIFYECSTKTRKKIVQSCKDVIVNLCTSKDAHLFLMAIIDQTDDTTLINKSIIGPVTKNLDEIVESVHGRKIIHFLLSQRDCRNLAKPTLDLLRLGDGNGNSKKDAETRGREIVGFCTKPLLQWLEPKIDGALKYAHSVNVVQSIVTKCLPNTDDLKVLYDNILSSIVMNINEEVIASQSTMKRKAKMESVVPKKKTKQNFTGKYDQDEEETEKAEDELEEEEKSLIECHLVEHLAGNMLVKSLCKLEREGKIVGFSAMCLEKITEENWHTFLNSNRTAFFLVFLYEINKETVQNFLRSTFTSFKNKMSESKFASVKILYQLLFGK